jgi:hypothetical protein
MPIPLSRIVQRSARLGIAFLMLLSLSAGAFGAEKQIEFHVAPDGSDANSGSSDAPFASLETARQAVRTSVAEGLKSDVLVTLHPGTYRLEKPLVLTGEDSGTHDYSITYSAASLEAWPDAAPQVTGGRTIEGWKQGEDGVWTARIAEVAAGQWWFRDLYADGRRLTRARFPNEGEYLRIAKVSKDVRDFELNTALPAGFSVAGSNAEFVAILNWSIDRGRIAEATSNTARTATPMGFLGHGSCTARAGQAGFVEHARAFLDVPGEWYLERATGVLHYKAAEDEDPSQMEFTAPVLDEILVIEGTKEAPVRNVHFRGIDFACATWSLPSFGYRGVQAATYGTGYETEPTFAMAVAVRMNHWRGGTFERCRVRQTGASGMGLGGGCRGNLVVGCEFDDIGGNGVAIGWRGYADKLPRYFFDTDWTDPEDVPRDNEISNCYVHRCGAIAYGAVGIFEAFAQNSLIAHNAVTDLPYTGISTGFRWDTTTSTQRASRIEYNHIWDVMQILADGGCIYTLGWQPHTVLRGNLMHDVLRSSIAHGGAPNNGIFFDQGSKAYRVEENTTFNTSGKPIRFNQCRYEWHTWRGNAWNVGPMHPDFPWARAALAGPEPAWRVDWGEWPVR